MHRALLLPEIVTKIVEELSDLDLYTLARTCQAFTEPALDVLWRDPTAGNAVLAERMAPELWTIEPLEFTPDNDIWDPNDIRNWQNMVVFREGVDPRKLKDEDLGMRFAYYAKRLTCLTLSNRGRGGRQRTVLPDSTILAMWSQMEHLFLRLRTAHVDGVYLADPTYACRGFGSFLRFRGLRTLRISAHGGLLEAAAEFRDSLVDACSRIKALIMISPHSYTSDEEKWATLCGDMLTSAHHLRVLNLNGGISIHTDSLMSLAKIPVLEHLKITFSTNCASDIVFPNMAFPSLRILDVGDFEPDARGAISLLAQCASNRLEKLELLLKCRMMDDCMTTLLHQIGRHAKLIHLSLISYGIPISSEPVTQFTSFLEALKPLPLLQSLQVHGDATLPIHLDTVAHVVQLYPQLRKWKLSNCAGTYTVEMEQAARTPVTLYVLMEILRSHPHLTGLPLVVDSPDLPSEEAQARFGVHSCYVPSVRHSAATPALRLAIQKMFPQARI